MCMCMCVYVCVCVCMCMCVYVCKCVYVCVDGSQSISGALRTEVASLDMSLNESPAVGFMVQVGDHT